ncbi:endonuclease/exonuclease/phosphatase family protein [Streptomyces boluensis]|uniref:endonuclease/exonuclease/phosphatase family protein n=1 Tax=Streptomyces boluensis TaxID=1775135 RepID=UPI001FE53C79|nr:endonuclease/exonuclease/phosphatase family protein [Streptomyces boluensis]
MLLAGVSVVLLCRALDVDGVTPVPQLLAFLPWLLVPAGAGLAFAALARWRTGVVWGVLALAVTGWFCRPYGDAAAPDGPAAAQVRVLTSNVEYGGATEELIRAVVREKPDLVFVQECDLRCSGALERRLGERFPHRSLVEATGAEGSAILSRYPLRRTAGVRGTLGMPGAVADVEGHAVRLQLAHPMPPVPGGVGLWRSELDGLRDEAAGAGAGAEAATDRDTATGTDTRTDTDTRTRTRTGTGKATVTRTDTGTGIRTERNPGTDQPTILAGDFNAGQDHAAFRRILDTGLRDSTRLAGGTRTPTWPASTAPPLGTQIDHVLVSRHFAARDARFLDLAHTDHRSLVVDLTLHSTLHSGKGR